MSKTDREYLEKLRAHAAQTRTFLSNKMKPERERSVCRAFLRSLGVTFQDSELIAPTGEPVDVAFRNARFQVRDLLEPNRRRGDDWKKREEKYKSARYLGEVTAPNQSPTPIEFEVLIPEVATAISEKATRYGQGCSDLDVLVYVNLTSTFLAANAKVTDTESLKSQGWRSVSLLYPPYGVVLIAAEDAPAFLKEVEREVRMKWTDIDTLFER